MDLEKIIDRTAWVLLVGAGLYLIGREFEKYGAKHRNEQYNLSFNKNEEEELFI